MCRGFLVGNYDLKNSCDHGTEGNDHVFLR